MTEWKRASKIVCEVIEQHGLGRVAGFDGCECGSFSIGGIEAFISCRKSSRNRSTMPGQAGKYGTAVYVWHGGFDCDKPGLLTAARAITDNLTTPYFAVRFCDPEHDREIRCVYCHEPRSAPTAYLCEAHQNSMEHAEPSAYDFRDIEYSRDGDDDDD